MKSMMEFDSPRRCGVQVIAFISVMLLFASTTAVALEREPTKRRIAPYLARLKDTSRDVRLEAAQALGEIEWPDEPDKAVAALIDVLKNDLAGTVRAAAAQALANFFWGEARISAVQALIDSLKDTDADVCATAVETLCRIVNDLSQLSLHLQIR